MSNSLKGLSILAEFVKQNNYLEENIYKNKVRKQFNLMSIYSIYK